MMVVQVTDGGGAKRAMRIETPEAVIGRHSSCDVRLESWRVGKTHARLTRTRGGILIEDLGHMTGTWINGARIVQHGPLTAGDEIAIGGFKLRVQEPPAKSNGAAANTPVAKGLVRSALSPAQRAPAAPPAKPVTPHAARSPEQAASQDRIVWRRKLHEKLLDTIDLRRRDFTRMSDDEIRTETQAVIRELMGRESQLPPQIDRAALLHEVLNEAVGLGPLEDLLADESVSEIMVNRFDEVYVERSGRLVQHSTSFSSDRAVMGVIERIVAPLGRRIDESSPLVDARLKDGSRVNAIIPPLALKGPTLTIRKFAKKRLEAEHLIGYGSLSMPMALFLRVCVEQRKNIVVSGGTGSGKTTFLNVLSNFIPNGERIVTIEDAAELKLNHSHLISLEARPSNVEGRGQVSIRDLVKNSLRMRPDRIVVGECRGGEALDMLQAMNTGHEGSLTTLHANTPRDALSRLETLVLMAGMDLPLPAIRDQIASAVDILVQQTRFACGSRKITSITEVTGMENGRLQMQEIFRFNRTGYGEDGKVRGAFVACDLVPTFYEELRAQGVALDLEIFRA
ncbi:MAG: Flp pilus assembly complex ATPase component TadA [Burkholderiaceae bacterium]|nr:Flp pilus assembly complex ATPase component TadA [Burkholderiaceae bacterium]